MNRILREKFVELYEIPILENVKYLSGTYLRSISFLFRQLAVFFSLSCVYYKKHQIILY